MRAKTFIMFGLASDVVGIDVLISGQSEFLGCVVGGCIILTILLIVNNLLLIMDFLISILLQAF